jgi:hypothetical protein
MNIPSPPITTRKAVSYFGAITVFAFAAAMAQVSFGADTGIDDTGNYQKERGWCMVNTVGEERATCLRDSAAAQAEKRQGTLDNHNVSANATRRCDVYSGEDRLACIARVKGYGSESGSVQGGGIIRQVETITLPAPAGQDSVIVVPKKP